MRIDNFFFNVKKISIEDCKKIIVKLHCHTHELALDLGVENDLVIYYNKEGNVADDVYEYDEAKIFTPAGQEVSFSGTCPKETRSRKKCAQKRLQLGSDNNVIYFLISKFFQQFLVCFVLKIRAFQTGWRILQKYSKHARFHESANLPDWIWRKSTVLLLFSLETIINELEYLKQKLKF